MRKLTTTVAAMAVALAVFGQNPGLINATKEGTAITLLNIQKPTNNAIWKLLGCQMEVVWVQNGLKRHFEPCPCNAKHTVTLPSWANATSYEVKRRAYWQHFSGTKWKWSNPVILN